MPACSASYPCGEGLCALSAASFLASHSHRRPFVDSGSLAIHAAETRPPRPGTRPPWPAGRFQPAGDPGQPRPGCSPRTGRVLRRAAPGGATSWSGSWSGGRARPAADPFGLFSSAIADQHLAAV